MNGRLTTSLEVEQKIIELQKLLNSNLAHTLSNFGGLKNGKEYPDM